MFYEYLQFFLSILTGIGISSLIVTYICFLPLKSNEKIITDPLILYLTKYKDSFDEFETKELSEERIESLKNTKLFEYTPTGNVIMYYEDEQFKYFCDRNLSFGFLESIAQKYVMMFDCKSIYKIFNKEKQDTYFNSKKEEKEVAKKKKSVYASFKKYNKNNIMKIDDNEPILQNKYLYIGKIRDFSFYKKQEIITKKMNIQDFLNQIKNKSVEKNL